MDTTNSISINYQGVTLAASGTTAIIIVIASSMLCAGVYLIGKKRGIW